MHKREEDKRKREESKDQERLKREEEKRKKDEEKEQERLKREEEKRKKNEEKEQERIKREEEKRKKDEEKEQEKIKREEEKRKKDEEKEQERLKREEEKRKKDEEKRRKDEEKEQQRLKREEEKEKKELERKQKLDEKEKEKLKEEELKSKQAEFLTRFLHKTPTRKSRSGGELDKSPRSLNGESSAGDTTVSEDRILEIDVSKCDSELGISAISEEPPTSTIFNPMPFQVKTGMALASHIRRLLTTEEKTKVDLIINTEIELEISLVESEIDTDKLVEMAIDVESENGIDQGLYLRALKNGLGRNSKRTEVKREILDEDNEIQIIDTLDDLGRDDGLIKWRWKLIQFHENTRPAYWGTWKRRPLKVKGRCPFKQEEELDYEFDSDDEWEEEPVDGEDLNSEKENEDEPDPVNPEDPDEEEDEWMVPHGYLSDDEGASENKPDKDTLKCQEEEFYNNLKRENTLGIPIIETENLYQYQMIFPSKKIRRGAQRVSTKPFNEVLSELKSGTYDGELLESDEEDGDYEESESSDYDSDQTTDSVASSDLDNDVDEISCSSPKKKKIDTEIEKADDEDETEEAEIDKVEDEIEVAEVKDVVEVSDVKGTEVGDVGIEIDVDIPIVNGICNL